MTKQLRTATILLVSVLNTAGMARIFFVGSNPYLSWIAFPQDISRLHDDFILYSLYYQQLPWWGDIDEISNRPNDSYTVTRQSVLSPHQGEVQPFFSQGATVHNVEKRFGLHHTHSPDLKSLTLLDYTLNSAVSRASGLLRNSQTRIDFEYANLSMLNSLYLQPVFAFSMAGIPLGLKAGWGFENNVHLSSTMDFMIDSTRNVSSRRLLWGWSTQGCSHIFGPGGLQGDAWFQNEYARGPLYRFDLQAGATLTDLKMGVRYRNLSGKQSQFSWRTTPDAQDRIDSSFSGEYAESDWRKHTGNHILRLYGNYTLRRTEHYALNTLLFLGYEHSGSGNALAGNVNVTRDSRDIKNSFVLEVNPNVNIKPGGPHGYIDAAVLLMYGYSRYDNYNEIWVEGGRTRAHRNSTVYRSDEYSWHRFSYADEHFYDAGIDMSLGLPLYRDDHQTLSLGLISMFNNQFTFTTKYYGETQVSGSEVDFNVRNRRENFMRETWFNTSLSLNLRRAPYMLRFDITQPLLYQMAPRTRVTDAAGNEVLYQSNNAGPFSSQQGLKTGIWVIRDFTLKLPLDAK